MKKNTIFILLGFGVLATITYLLGKKGKLPKPLQGIYDKVVPQKITEATPEDVAQFEKKFNLEDNEESI